MSALTTRMRATILQFVLPSKRLTGNPVQHVNSEHIPTEAVERDTDRAALADGYAELLRGDLQLAGYTVEDGETRRHFYVTRATIDERLAVRISVKRFYVRARIYGVNGKLEVRSIEVGRDADRTVVSFRNASTAMVAKAFLDLRKGQNSNDG